MKRIARSGFTLLELLVVITIIAILSAALFGAYVLRHPEIFAAQIIGNGSANYLTFELPRRLFDPALWRSLPEGPCSLEREVLPPLAAAGMLRGFRSPGSFFDIGTPEEWERAERRFGT